jgi:hypothetical protein
MKRIAALMMLAALVGPAQAQDVTITKGQGGEIIITGGKRTPPRVETSEETEARRAAQERAFESGTARTIQQQEARERAASAAAVRDAEWREREESQKRQRDAEELERQQDRAKYYERRANKSESAWGHAYNKDEQRDAQEKANKLKMKLSQP